MTPTPPDPDPAVFSAASAPAVTSSKLSAAIARGFLRGGNYPWLRVAGAVQRERSRKVGGRRFTVQRPAQHGHDVTLDAWFSPASPAAKQRHPGKIPVLICHGIFEHKERYFDRAAWLNARGHDVVLFDHRTHGRSTGKRLTMGVLEKQDVAAVLDVALEKQLIPTLVGQPPRVVTLGFSLGGGTVLQHAAQDDRVAGVVALAPFADFTAAIESFRKCFAPWLPHDWVHQGFGSAAAEAGFAVEQASALHAIPHIRVPILLVEAGKDTYLPPQHHTQRLAQERIDLPKPHDASLTVFNLPDANHLSLVRKRWPTLDATLGQFLDQFEDPDRRA